CPTSRVFVVVFFFQAEDGIRDRTVTGVQTCALPIFARRLLASGADARSCDRFGRTPLDWAVLDGWASLAEILGVRVEATGAGSRSEEHTSELQSPYDLVCRLLLEKKKKKKKQTTRCE